MELNDLLDSYADICTGTFYIRVPEILGLLDKYPTIGLKSSYTHEKKDMIINAKKVVLDIHKEGRKASPTLRNTMDQIGKIFLIWTKDIVFDKISMRQDLIDSEIIQYLIHMRNGCAHNNCFNIISSKIDSAGNLKKKAMWREKEIIPSLNGSIVVPDFMKDGDIFNLIIDLQEYLIKNGVF